MYRASELRLDAVSFRKTQAGAALLVILLLLISAASFLFVRKLNYVASARTADIRTTADALIEAKNALLGFAATYPDKYGTSDPLAGPGFLPCPDTNGDGSPNPPCVANQIGRFPWRFIGISDFFDGSGERLWYSLSGNFRNNPKTFPLNAQTPGQLVIDGTIGDVVAVIIAPGEPIVNPPAVNQQRSAGPNDVTNYLEGENANGDATYVTSGANLNDRLIYITRQELMTFVEKRVLGAARQVLQDYYITHNYYPYASNLGSAMGSQVGVPGQLQGFLPIDTDGTEPNPPLPFPPVTPPPSPGWFRQNQWPNFLYYTLANACQSTTPGCSGSGLLTVSGATNVQALLISAGRAITTPPFAVKGSAQDRTSLPPPPPPWPVNEYLDSAENTNGDPVYDAAGTPITPSYNDQMKIVAP